MRPRGCNNGPETLSLAAVGARRCLGIDQSAEILKGIAGLDCEFLCADIYAVKAAQLPMSFTLTGRRDGG